MSAISIELPWRLPLDLCNLSELNGKPIGWILPPLINSWINMNAIGACLGWRGGRGGGEGEAGGERVTGLGQKMLAAAYCDSFKLV